jgi:AcrR family transcriptional regulator
MAKKKKPRKNLNSKGSSRSKSSLPPPHLQELDSRDLLVASAKKVFAQRGFEGTTVKDLADNAGVNISLVSYHFGGKEGLYRTCLESFTMERIEATERILQPAQSTEEFKLRLKLYAEEVIDLHRRDPDTCSMIHRALSTQDQITCEVFEKVFLRAFESLKSFISAAQKSGFVRKDLDTELAAGIAFGGLMHVLQGQNLMRLLGRSTIIDDQERAKALIEHWIAVNTRGLFSQHETRQ